MTLNDTFFFDNHLEWLFLFTNMLNDFELINNDGKVVHKHVEVFFFFFKVIIIKKKGKPNIIILANQAG